MEKELTWLKAIEKAALEQFISKVQMNKGKRFGFLLPFEIEGVVNEYSFWFEVQEASVNQ